MNIEQLLLLKKDLLRQKRQNATSLKAMQAEVSELIAQVDKMDYSHIVRKWTSISTKYIGTMNKLHDRFDENSWYKKNSRFKGLIHRLIHEGFYKDRDETVSFRNHRVAWEVYHLIYSVQKHSFAVSSKMEQAIMPFALARSTEDFRLLKTQTQKGGGE